MPTFLCTLNSLVVGTRFNDNAHRRGFLFSRRRCVVSIILLFDFILIAPNFIVIIIIISKHGYLYYGVLPAAVLQYNINTMCCFLDARQRNKNENCLLFSGTNNIALIYISYIHRNYSRADTACTYFNYDGRTYI